MSNVDAIRAVIDAYAPNDPPLGTRVHMADYEQTFELCGVEFRRNRSGKSVPVYLWSAPCVLCSAPFEQMTATRFGGFTRTCPTHRGRMPPKPPKPRKPRKPRAKTGPKTGGVQAVALVVAAEQALVRPGMPAYALADLVTKRLPAPAAGARDTRLQVAVRALRLLAKRPDVPFVEADGWFMFDGHDLV